MPNLAQLTQGASAQLSAFHGHPALAQRLLAMGLRPGQTLQRAQQAPLAGPIKIHSDLSVIALRTEDAAALELHPNGPS